MGERNQLFDQQNVKHQEVLDRLVREASPRRTFLMLMIISSLIAVLGLLHENTAVVIGAMLVAPMLWPILGISMSFVVRDWRMLRLSIVSIVMGVALALATSITVTLFYVPLGSELEVVRDMPFLVSALVAVGAGAAAAFALCFEHIKEAVTGVAISVALVPPLAAIGIGLGGTDWDLMSISVKALVVNLVGIILVSMVIFMMLGFGRHRREAMNASKKEEKVLSKN